MIISAPFRELTNALAQTHNVRVFSNWALPLLSTRAFWLAKCWMSWIMRGLWRAGCLRHLPHAGCFEAPCVRLAMSVRAPSGALGGPSCLAGDVIGTYGFDALPQAGDRLAFLDQAHYSMVKTTTFNGVPAGLPYGTATRMLCAWCAFDYADFEGRLS